MAAAWSSGDARRGAGAIWRIHCASACCTSGRGSLVTSQIFRLLLRKASAQIRGTSSSTAAV
eukprot:9601714-Alexandrium_andersonii.AAC.1